MSRRVSTIRGPKASLSSKALEHLRRVVQVIHAQSVAIESATGLTGPQFWALREVARARDGITLGELARRLALHKANAGRLADRLARKRLITRETPPDDRRVVLVRITAAGLCKSEIPVSAPPQADLLSRLEALPGRDLSAIEHALSRLVTLLGAEGEEAGPLFESRGRSERAHSTPRGGPRRRPAR
jgi:MarR family transcriptional regulator, 2-MHQ and catechol-resistance regulon repressor